MNMRVLKSTISIGILIVLALLFVQLVIASSNYYTWDEQNKTASIYKTSQKWMTIKSLGLTSGIVEFRETIAVSSNYNYVFNEIIDFGLETEVHKGKRDVTSKEYYLHVNTSYNVSINDYGWQNETVWQNTTADNVTWVNQTVWQNKSVITGNHLETRYRDELQLYTPTNKKIDAGQTLVFDIVVKKQAELGEFSILIQPVFMGEKIKELTWWNTSVPYRINGSIQNGTRPRTLDFNISVTNEANVNGSWIHDPRIVFNKLNVTHYNLNFYLIKDDELDIPIYLSDTSIDNTTANVFTRLLTNASTYGIYFGVNYTINNSAQCELSGKFCESGLGSSINLSKWQGDTSFVYVSNGNFNLSPTTTTKTVASIMTFNPNTYLRIVGRTKMGVDSGVFGFRDYSNSNLRFMGYFDSTLNRVYSNANNVNTNWSTANVTTLKEFYWGTSQVDWYENGIRSLGSPYTLTVPTTALNILFSSQNGASAQDFSEIFAYELYAEPKWATWGATESAPTSASTYIPPTPINCQATTGNFYVNMSCDAGSGNGTDGTNKSVNGVFYNDTAFFKNVTLSAHAWGNGSFYAWNNSGGGILNSTPATLNTQIPNNPITISGVSSSYSLNEGQPLTITPSSSDADSDIAVYTTNATLGSINSGTGVYTLNSVVGNQGVYNWNISVTDNNGSTSIVNFTVTINYALLPTVEPSGVYAFLNNSIPSNATILNYKNNNLLTTVVTLDWDNITSNNWTSLLGGINYSYTNGIRTALRLNFGGDYTNTTIQNNVKTNITLYFPDTKNDPYQSDIQWIEINFTNTTSPNADKRAYANLTAKNISEQSGNKFPVYTVEAISGLDADYVKSSPLIYLNLTNKSDYVSKESITTRGNTTLSRVYSGNETVLPLISYYKTGVFNRLRGSIATTHPTESYASNVSNSTGGYDLILYNNLSTTQNRTVANIIGTYLDVNSDLMEKFTSSGTLYFNVSAENFSYIINEAVDKIVLNDTAHKVYGAEINYNETFVHGSNQYDSYIYAGSNSDIKMELYDPTYSQQNLTMIHYEWINASKISNYTPYPYVIVADQNANEINSTINRTNDSNPLRRPFIYYSIADYTDNGGAWAAAKKAEISWALSRGYNAFIDGIDSAVQTGGNFSADTKDVLSFIRVNNSKKVICNTYTAYQQFATVCDVLMKESAFSRWDGNVTYPVYSWEDMTLEKQRADYYTSHNIPVILMSFGDVTDYEKKNFDYLAGAVLYGYNGNNTFRYGQPNFQNQQEIYVQDLGTMLESGYTETSSTDWNRLYSKGRVHINPVAHTASIDNNKVINSMSVDLYVYSGGVGSGDRNVTLTVNKPNGTFYNLTYGSETTGQWFWKNINIPITEYKEHGQYNIYFATRPIAGGWNFIGKDNTAKTGTHSWYDTTGANINTANNDTDFTWTALPRDIQFISRLNVDYNTTLQIDTLALSTITQSDSRSSFNRTVNITSTNEYNTSIYSNPIRLITSAISSMWFRATNGTWYSANLPSTNVSDINASSPSWTTTTVDGLIYGVIQQYVSTDSWWVRFLFPHLSTQQAMVGENVAPTVPVLIQHADFHTTGGTTVNFTASTDSNSDPITYDIKVYNTTTGVLVVNQTGTGNNYSTDFNTANWTNYNYSVRAYDGLNNSDWAGALTFGFTNALPVIANTTNQTVNENNTVFVDIDGSDADGDGLVFSINRTDLFTDFSTSTGKGNWTTNFTSSGTYYVDFGLSDGYNNTNYTTVITIPDVPLSFSTFTPAGDVSVIKDTSQAFTVTLNRAANVTWKLDGASVQTNNSITIANYTNNGTSTGTFNITVNATDGIDSVSRTWFLTVSAQTTTSTSRGGSGGSSISPATTETPIPWSDGRKDYSFSVLFEGTDGRMEPLESGKHGITALNMFFKTPVKGTYTITISTYTDFKPPLNGSLKYFSIYPNFDLKPNSNIELTSDKAIELYQLYDDWKKLPKGTKLSNNTYRFPITSFGVFAIKQGKQEDIENTTQTESILDSIGTLNASRVFKNIEIKDKAAYEMLKVKFESIKDFSFSEATKNIKIQDNKTYEFLKVKLVWLVEIIEGLKGLISEKVNTLL